MCDLGRVEYVAPEEIVERFKNLILEALAQRLDLPKTDINLETPPDAARGDFAFACFRLSKIRRLAPQIIAQDLAHSLTLAPAIQVEAVGAYVNFKIALKALRDQILPEILRADPCTYGQLPVGSRGRWVLEFSSPNIAKPLNIYHLRPTALGAALDRIGRARGYDMITINHLGDWGKQYGMLLVGLERFATAFEDAELSIELLVQVYVQINAAAKSDPTIQEAARRAFLKLEQGDPAARAIWQRCVQVSLREFDRIYARLGVRFDHIWPESFYENQLPSLLERLKKQNLLVESEGAQVVFLDPPADTQAPPIPPCLILKNDGASLYATRDLAAALYRYEKFHFDRMSYIVGGEQKLHFLQIFGVLKKMGYTWVDHCEHIPTGIYRFNDQKMSTRQGNFVTLLEVMETTQAAVARLVRARNATLEDSTPALFAEITEKVALGALLFADLHSDPARDLDFDVERIIDFEGTTGPYLQYAHTRCQSLLRKARHTMDSKAPPWSLESSSDRESTVGTTLTHPAEDQLIRVLAFFPTAMEESLKLTRASRLCQYLIDLTQSFGLFYRECPVLSAEMPLLQDRLLLVEATRRVLAQGLVLLGIPLPPQM